MEYRLASDPFLPGITWPRNSPRFKRATQTLRSKYKNKDMENMQTAQHESPHLNSSAVRQHRCGHDVWKFIVVTLYCCINVSPNQPWLKQFFLTKNLKRIIIQSVTLNKCTDEDLRLIPGCCTAAAHCPPRTGWHKCRKQISLCIATYTYVTHKVSSS